MLFCLFFIIFARILFVLLLYYNTFTVLFNIDTLGLANFPIVPTRFQISVLIKQSLTVNFFIEPVQVDIDLVSFLPDSILKELEQ